MPKSANIRVSVVDMPAFTILVDALMEISRMESGDTDLAPAIAKRAAIDALSIVQEHRP